MIIKPYTADETDELIRKIYFVLDQAIAVNKKANDLLDELYDKYLSNFKISLFFWKPLSKKKFLQYISNTESANRIIVTEDWYWDKTPIRNKIPKGTVLFRAENVYMFYSSKFLRKYNIEFKTEQKMLFADATIFASYIQSYDNNNKIKVILNYAKQPFEFEESDVEWIEEFDHIYKTAMRYV